MGAVGALEQANRQLRELTLHDPLTGLLNRRGLDEALARAAETPGASARGTLALAGQTRGRERSELCFSAA